MADASLLLARRSGLTVKISFNRPLLSGLARAHRKTLAAKLMAFNGGADKTGEQRMSGRRLRLELRVELYG